MFIFLKYVPAVGKGKPEIKIIHFQKELFESVTANIGTTVAEIFGETNWRRCRRVSGPRLFSKPESEPPKPGTVIGSHQLRPSVL